VIDGKEITVAGSGAWKTFTVKDPASSKALLERKFYKSDFKDLIDDPECSVYIDQLLHAVLVRNYSSSVEDVDTDAYEEVRSVAMELEDDIIISGN